jgi:hypothetical protein
MPDTRYDRIEGSRNLRRRLAKLSIFLLTARRGEQRGFRSLCMAFVISG